MEKQTHYVSADTLQQFMEDMFTASEISTDDAKICADVLITSDLRGIESHGVGRLKMYYDRIKAGQINTKTQLEIIRQSPTTAMVDAHDSIGMVVGARAMQMAIDKARTHGMGSVAVRNSTHFGIDGYYALMAVDAGMIGMAFTNARPSIAPTFSVQPMLGTNPIAFGAPTDEECPFLFDAATSIIQRGKVEVASREEKKLPRGVVTDHEGNELQDPDIILKSLTAQQAALLPLGGAGEDLAGYKGYCLATVVEILCASLQGGAFLHGLTGSDADGKYVPHQLGHFFMAINIESFVPLDEFKATTGKILRELRDAEKAPGCKRIYTAGEKEFEKGKVVRERGVPIIPNLQKDIKIVQEELGLTGYEFPF